MILAIMVSLPHTHYSLDLIPADLHLFLKMKMQFKHCSFNTAVEIKSKAQVLNLHTANSWISKGAVTMLKLIYISYFFTEQNKSGKSLIPLRISHLKNFYSEFKC